MQQNELMLTALQNAIQNRMQRQKMENDADAQDASTAAQILQQGTSITNNMADQEGANIRAQMVAKQQSEALARQLAHDQAQAEHWQGLQANQLRGQDLGAENAKLRTEAAARQAAELAEMRRRGQDNEKTIADMKLAWEREKFPQDMDARMARARVQGNQPRASDNPVIEAPDEGAPYRDTANKIRAAIAGITNRQVGAMGQIDMNGLMPDVANRVKQLQQEFAQNMAEAKANNIDMMAKPKKYVLDKKTHKASPVEFQGQPAPAPGGGMSADDRRKFGLE